MTAPLPLAGTRVLVPRATEGPDPLVIALTAAGATPVVVPLIQTVPPEDPTEIDDTLLALDSGYYTWLAVTSSATVSVLVDRADEVDLSLSAALAGTRVAAVGPSTARALREAGVQVDLVPPRASSAEALVAAWPTHPDLAPAADDRPRPPATAARVLLPLGDLAVPTLADGLRARGWTVDQVVAYRTVPGPAPDPATRTDWQRGGLDAVVLTSGSTARHLLEMLGGVPPGTLVCCIGPSTAAEARRLGLDVAAVATEQTPAGLVQALTTALANRPSRPADPIPDVPTDPTGGPR
ncbi:uroporphyrinogen-III synthase [Cellulomonas hominis]